MSEDFIQISISLIPVYLFIASGFLFRKIHWLSERSDASLLKLQINVFYPCLIFSYIFGNEALKDPALLIFPPLVGFGSIILGFAIAYLVARVVKLERGKGLRTFTYTAGIYNYGFIAIPLINAVYHSRTFTATLMVHNTGIELAIWTIGILLLTGSIGKGAWKKLLNPPILALLLGLILNFVMPTSDVGEHKNGFLLLSDSVIGTVEQLGQCSIPLALMLIGASIRDLLGDKQLKIDWKIIAGGCVARLLILPVIFIFAAVHLPLPHELKIVMLIQAAMPSAMFPILIAKHYGGSPQTAVQITLSTTLLSIITIPIWVTIGQHLAGF